MSSGVAEGFRPVWGVLLLLGVALNGWLIFGVDFQSNDFRGCLTGWTNFLASNGGWRSYHMDHTWNYPMPYIYFLTLIAPLSIPLRLICIKAFSTAFSYLMAWAGGKIAERISGRQAFWAALTLLPLLPTVFLNAGYWGQCDAIYASLVMLGVLALMQGRRQAPMIWFGLGLMFKLQAIFLLPLFILFALRRRIPWSSFLWPFVFWILGGLPAVLVGAPLKPTYNPLWSQMTHYVLAARSLFPSLWAFGGSYQLTKPVIVGGMTVAVLGGCWLLWMMRQRLGSLSGVREQRFILATAFICASCIPWLLPGMHDRYLYPGDVLGLVWLITMTGRLRWLGLAPEVFSLINYGNYLWIDDSIPWVNSPWVGITMAILYTPVVFLLVRNYYTTYLRHS